MLHPPCVSCQPPKLFFEVRDVKTVLCFFNITIHPPPKKDSITPSMAPGLDVLVCAVCGNRLQTHANIMCDSPPQKNALVALPYVVWLSWKVYVYVGAPKLPPTSFGFQQLLQSKTADHPPLMGPRDTSVG